MTTTQNGWPALSASSRLLTTWTIPAPADEPGAGVTRLKMRVGSAGFLLAHLALWFSVRVESLVEPVLDDWGWAFRPVRGYAILSNHASGTAVDLNATDHPMGVATRDTFTDAEIGLIRRRLDLYGGCIRWGGDYQSRPDGMHFELDRDLATCERRARALMDTPRGARILTANPAQRRIILS